MSNLGSEMKILVLGCVDQAVMAASVPSHTDDVQKASVTFTAVTQSWIWILKCWKIRRNMIFFPPKIV